VTEDEIIDLPPVYLAFASSPRTRRWAHRKWPGVWGDSFFFYDPNDVPEDRRFPFTTIVTKDYGGFDEASNLDREGVYRLNVSVGRERFTELIGYPPAQHDEHENDFDYTLIDTVVPHPAYGKQAWVSILNPGARTSDQARALSLKLTTARLPGTGSRTTR
jgi:hypothetical protein